MLRLELPEPSLKIGFLPNLIPFDRFHASSVNHLRLIPKYPEPQAEAMSLTMFPAAQKKTLAHKCL
jgi:hypothetical protein